VVNTLSSEDIPPTYLSCIEVGLSWNCGSVLARTQTRQSIDHYKFVRNDVVIGIILSGESGSGLASDVYVDHVLYKDLAVHNLIVIPSGHEIECCSRRGGRTLWIFFDPRELAQDQRVQSFIQTTTVDCSWTNDRLLRTVVAEIAKECSNEFPRGPKFLERAAMLFVTQLAYFLVLPASRAEPHPLSNERLQLVLEYFNHNLGHNITLSEASRLINLSPSYFCAAFKKAFGTSPHQFQIELRVERAKTLLVDSALSLVDVALLSGFSSQSHLSDCFRRITGVSPARYRAEIRAKAEPGRQFGTATAFKPLGEHIHSLDIAPKTLDRGPAAPTKNEERAGMQIAPPPDRRILCGYRCDR
jgi:AraC family transcriptional regulator